MNADIDMFLHPVSKCGARVTNDILDLREAALSRNDPGQCVNCYYRIFEVLAPNEAHALAHLRQWLERHLVIVARDETCRELERLPVSLHRKDLESFCREVILEFRANRNYNSSSIEISLDFKDRTAA
ncbi:MAG: hypothetical protein AAGC73_10665 [Verrucomicrobiota bacterium]